MSKREAGEWRKLAVRVERTMRPSFPNAPVGRRRKWWERLWEWGEPQAFEWGAYGLCGEVEYMSARAAERFASTYGYGRSTYRCWWPETEAGYKGPRGGVLSVGGDGERR